MNVGASPAADLVWQQRLRPFLNHPGIRASEGFHKPSNPVHRPLSQTGASQSALSLRLLRPFTSSDGQAQSPSRSQHEEKRTPKQRRSPRQRPTGKNVGPQPEEPQPEIGYRSCSSPSGSSADEHRWRQPAGVSVHDFQDPFADGDPSLIYFSEEPDDDRVFVPAHRIGDTPEPKPAGRSRASPSPTRPSPRSHRRLDQSHQPRRAGVLSGSSIVSSRFGRLLEGVAQRHRKPIRISNSSPHFFLAAKQINFHKPLQGAGGWSSCNVDALGSGVSPEEQAALACLFDDANSKGDLLDLLER